MDFKLKSRDEHLSEIKDSGTIFDLLIVGGGSNGAAVALDAASRGLKCLLVDKADFTSGRTSK